MVTQQILNDCDSIHGITDYLCRELGLSVENSMFFGSMCSAVIGFEVNKKFPKFEKIPCSLNIFAFTEK